jgi:hypothetical protein
MFYEAQYSLKNNRNIHPYDFSVRYQQGDNMSKLMMEAHYSITYSARKSINFRAFAGVFIDTTNAGPYRFRMSGWGPLGIGNHDYLYDHTFLGRSETTGLLAQQMVEQDGGFKIYSPVGQSARWLIAFNMDAELPFKNKWLSKVHIYADAGMCGEDGRGSESFIYNAGLKVAVAVSGYSKLLRSCRFRIWQSDSIHI